MSGETWQTQMPPYRIQALTEWFENCVERVSWPSQSPDLRFFFTAIIKTLSEGTSFQGALKANNTSTRHSVLVFFQSSIYQQIIIRVLNHFLLLLQRRHWSALQPLTCPISHCCSVELQLHPEENNGQLFCYLIHCLSHLSSKNVQTLIVPASPMEK